MVTFCLLFQAFKPETVLSFFSLGLSGSIVMHLDANGEITESLQDATGSTVKSVSEVFDHNGVLYFGSYFAPYIGKLKLSKLV